MLFYFQYLLLSTVVTSVHRLTSYLTVCGYVFEVPCNMFKWRLRSTGQSATRPILLVVGFNASHVKTQYLIGQYFTSAFWRTLQELENHCKCYFLTCHHWGVGVVGVCHVTGGWWNVVELYFGGVYKWIKRASFFFIMKMVRTCLATVLTRCPRTSFDNIFTI